MVLSKLANRFRSVRYFGVRFQELRLELAKKFLALLFDDGGVGNRVGSRLRHLGRHFGHYGGYALVVLASGTGLEIGRIVQVAFRTR
jgi:hypothetical protein